MRDTLKGYLLEMFNACFNTNVWYEDHWPYTVTCTHVLKRIETISS